MGEIADSILDGDFCQCCGEYMEDEAGAGFPQTCAGCSDEEAMGKRNAQPKPNRQSRKKRV